MDRFSAEIAAITFSSEESASLVCMSEKFRLRIDVRQATMSLNLKIREINAGDVGVGLVGLEFDSRVDEDIISHIREQFLIFEKIW